VEKAIKEMMNRNATGVMIYLEMCSSYWEKIVGNIDKINENIYETG
jgi:hypothetical protein